MHEAATQIGWLGWFVPVMVIMVIIAIIAAVALVAKRYIRVGPNQAAVIFGRKRMVEETDASGASIKRKVGFRTICGGSTFVWPIFEKVDYLDLTEMTITIRTEKAVTKEGVLLTVQAIANVKIGSDDILLRNAAERLLGKPENEIQEMIKKTLEAHLRSICGTLTVESINSDRQAFSQSVTKEATEDLRKIGVVIDMIPVQHIEDEEGYILSLGRKRTSEVKRDADIGVAEAGRESTIKTTDAHREGEIVRNNNEAKEKEAAKEKEVKVQNYLAETESAKAKAEQAGPLAKAKAEQEVVIQQVKVQEEKTRAQIAVEEQEIEKEKKAQEAKIIVPANAKAQADVKVAEGYKTAETARADGDKYAVIARADAEKHKREQEGLGEAEAIKAKGFAEAEVELKKLLAKAEGLLKIADAYKQFNSAAILLEISKVAPDIIGAFAPVMQSIAAPMGNIDKVVVIDSGGNGDGKSGALNRYANQVPDFLFNLMERAKAMGFDLSGLLSKAGVSADTIKTGSETSSKEKAS